MPDSHSNHSSYSYNNYMTSDNKTTQRELQAINVPVRRRDPYVDGHYQAAERRYKTTANDLVQTHSELEAVTCQ